MKKKLYIQIKEGGKLPTYLEFTSTHKDGIFCTMVDPVLEKRLQEDPDVEILKERKLYLDD